MRKSSPQRKVAFRRKRLLLFAAGAGLGGAVGLVLGSLLTFWLGDSTARAVQRGLRRIGGGDDRPSFDLLLQ